MIMKRSLNFFAFFFFLLADFGFSQSADKYSFRGDSCLEVGDSKAAIEYYSKSLKLNWKNCSVRYLRGFSYKTNGSYSEAIADFTKILKSDCGGSYQLKAFQNRGLCYELIGDLAAAEKDFSAYLKRCSDDYTLMQYGYVCWSLGKFKESIKAYTTLLNLKDQRYDKALIYFYRSSCFDSIDSLRLSMNDLQKAIQLDSSKIDYYAERFKLNMRLGNFNYAKEDVDLIRGLDVSDSIYSVYRGILYYYENKYAQAVDYLSQKIGKSPEHIIARKRRAMAYHRLKEYHKEISDLDTIIFLDSTNSGFYNTRGWAYLFIKNYRMALVDLNKSIAFDKTNVDAYDSRGCAKYFLGDYSGAIADFNFAISKNKVYANSYFHRAKCFVALKQFSKACADLGIAAELKDHTVFDGEKTLESLIADYCRK